MIKAKKTIRLFFTEYYEKKTEREKDTRSIFDENFDFVESQPVCLKHI